MLECPLCHGRRTLHQRVHVWVDVSCAACGLLLERTMAPASAVASHEPQRALLR